MKRAIFKKLGFSLITVLMLAFSIRWAFLGLFMPRTYYTTYDNLFSSSVQQELNRTVSSLWQQYRKQPAVLVKEIHRAHSFIDRVTIRCTPYRIMHIQVEAPKPLVIINDQWVLTAKGTILSKAITSETVHEELGHIQVVTSENKISEDPALLTFVKELPVSFYNDYTISWLDKTRVELRQKSDPLFSIITSGEKLITPELLAACSLIKKEFNARTSWSIDTRFDELIIMGGMG